MSRLLLGVLLILGACQTEVDEADMDSTAPETTAQTIQPDDVEIHSMYRTVARRVCELAFSTCDDPVSVSSSFSGDPTVTYELVPDTVRAAIREELVNVRFIDLEEDWDGAGDETVLLVGPWEMPTPNVVGIPAGFLCGNLCGSGGWFYFEWNGTTWQATTAEDLGIQTTQWES